jgi:hypothetical protein
VAKLRKLVTTCACIAASSLPHPCLTPRTRVGAADLLNGGCKLGLKSNTSSQICPDQVTYLTIQEPHDMTRALTELDGSRGLGMACLRGGSRPSTQAGRKTDGSCATPAGGPAGCGRMHRSRSAPWRLKRRQSSAWLSDDPAVLDIQVRAFPGRLKLVPLHAMRHPQSDSARPAQRRPAPHPVT